MGIAAILLGSIAIVGGKQIKKRNISGYIIWGILTLISLGTTIWNFIWLHFGSDNTPQGDLWVSTSFIWTIVFVIVYGTLLARLPIRKILIIVAILIVFMCIGYGGYAYYSNIYLPHELLARQSQQQSYANPFSNTPSNAAATTTLTHFENKIIGIAFDYPQKWHMTIISNATSVFDVNFLTLNSFYNPAYFLQVSTLYTGDSENTSISAQADAICKYYHYYFTYCSSIKNRNGVEYFRMVGKNNGVDFERDLVPTGKEIVDFNFTFDGGDTADPSQQEFHQLVESIRLE